MIVVVASGWQLLLKGGPMMWPLLLLSIVVLACGIRQWMYLGRLSKGLDARRTRILEALRQGPLKEALALCESRDDLMGEVLKSGILKFGASRDIIAGAMEETFARHGRDLHGRLSILSFITNAAPLIGLLGTVNSLVVLFQAAQMRSNALSPLAAGDMASGVWQALLTTQAGMFIALMSFIFYGFCALRMNTITAGADAAITAAANVLQQLSELHSQPQEQGDENV